MNDNISFLVKIFVLSSFLSILVKYGGQLLSLSPTVSIAIAAILLPSIILALTLIWKAQNQ
ncbi:hypothetical protein Xen7305DRAFT_00030710 [Xenococcus sp. PCC 7305]|uniref:hypothetical protein n=1 Tax=Xenococcus sp. PCC 7305 TaxID=102125 RepID=UPI0002AC455A|nr:hypothetical protein [Xenococcus sp. PCC 7305]ELS03349.1 hypothetical protein Xen7305DRAFT_00030710 [Xenococcus sp. PCC 7305]